MNKKHEILKWDSDFFGFKVARINHFFDYNDLEFIISKLRALDVRVAYLSINHNDIDKNNILKKINGFKADEKITYTINSNILHFDNCVEVSEYSENKPTEEMVQIAIQSGAFSRFRIDKNFGDELCDKLYKQWIQNATEKSKDNKILVYESEKKIRGFVSIKFVGNFGLISLIGVDEIFRGRNIGSKLLNNAILYLQNLNIYSVNVVTQKANEGACNFYEKNGFEMTSIQNIYHFWF